MIFFTGANYGYLLNAIFKTTNAKLQSEIYNFNKRHFCKLEFSKCGGFGDFSGEAFRTYCPKSQKEALRVKKLYDSV